MHYKISVIGKVQGVWFRKYTRKMALSQDLKGFVENSADGSVYIEAEGRSEDLDQFLEWLHRGSPMSRVDKVIRKEGPPVGFSNFEIRR